MEAGTRTQGMALQVHEEGSPDLTTGCCFSCLVGLTNLLPVKVIGSFAVIGEKNPKRVCMEEFKCEGRLYCE